MHVFNKWASLVFEILPNTVPLIHQYKYSIINIVSVFGQMTDVVLYFNKLFDRIASIARKDNYKETPEGNLCFCDVSQLLNI